MRTLSRPAAVAGGPAQVASASRLPKIADALLDASVAVMATWTVVYHLCLVLRLGVPWAVALEAVALTVWAVLWWRWRRVRRRAQPVHRTAPAPARPVAGWTSVEKVLVAVVVVSTVVAAAVLAVGGPWPWAAASWLSAAVGGTAVTGLRLRRAGDAGPQEPPAEPPAAGWRATAGRVVALAWAAALAALALFARRSNPDDLYYVNLSQWVARHGTFPLRDTIFSDLVYPMSSWPPVASYDALAGTVAYLADVNAASVVYLLVPPVATFLSVLALWRLLRQWRVPAVATALSLALVFLLFDGGPGYAAPGNLFLTRIWQGKVILLSVGVPLLLVYALRYIERPGWRRAGWLFAGGIAACGLTTSAMFLVPLIALTGALPLALRRPRRAALGFAALASYPLAAGVVTLAVGGRSADFFATRRLYRFDPSWFGPEILRDGTVAAVGVTAVLLGAVLLPRRVAGLMTGAAALIVGIIFVPGVTELSFDLVGLGPTLWRVSWIVPIAALVGVLGVRLGSLIRRRSLRAVPAVLLGVALAATGVPIWSEENFVVIDGPRWKVSYPVSAREAIGAAEPGDLILAPQGLAVTITVLTTEVKTVAPRDYFMDYLRDEPGFHYEERQTLLEFVNAGPAATTSQEVARALDVVGVDQVCVPLYEPWRRWFLRDEGYDLVETTPNFRCYAR